ncbi:hypothetical protein SAMN05444394_2113 [Algoriphagus halophilus]|uniref:Uncharacterized protein n=1 Tax=Algoriphagus halophilus TaxID=226505 RepID=A0A1N6EGA4_9BACT|nr:hypothetical protein SAMN05444394_2113 [Algoriphagus halophilus]
MYAENLFRTNLSFIIFVLISNYLLELIFVIKGSFFPGELRFFNNNYSCFPESKALTFIKNRSKEKHRH